MEHKVGPNILSMSTVCQFLLTTSNLMLYLLVHSYFASSQKASKPIAFGNVWCLAFVNVWCLSFTSGLVNTSAIISSFGQFFKHISWFFDEVMLYINMFDVRSVCGILCKCYASLIIAHDGCWYFLHISHIHQKLPKPNNFFHAMTSAHVFCLHHRQRNGWLFLAFPRNDFNSNTKTHTWWWLPVVCISHPICIAKTYEGNTLASEALFETKSPWNIS